MSGGPTAVARPAPETERDERPRPPRLLPIIAVAVLILATLVVIPRLDRDAEPTGLDPIAPTTTTPPPALTEARAAFGRPVAGALAYLGTDRIIHLVDMTSGDSLGSKGVDLDRRPAAVSRTHAFVGRLPALDGRRNWDEMRRLPWAPGSYLDLGPGTSLSYSVELDLVGATVADLEGGGSGVVVFGSDGTETAGPSSSGRWTFATWAGTHLLVREEIAGDTRWWLVEGRNPDRIEPVELPAGFLPIDGTDGLVFGTMDSAGVIVDLADGSVTRLPGKWSWGADWRPADRPILATVAEAIDGAPAVLIGYYADGAFAWSVPLDSPVTPFGGGVAWSPSGDSVAAAAGSTLVLVSAAGQIIGRLEPALPAPQTAPGAAFLQMVP